VNRIPVVMLATVLAAANSQVFAQAYPGKPIRTILTYSGGAEAIARLVAQKMSESMGVPVLIEAQSGAGGAVGANTVARAQPDGYTILSSTGSTQVQRGFMVRNVPYDPIKDFTPIAVGWETIVTVASNPSAPFASFKELLDYAKRNPGKVSYGTSGIGTSHHLALEEINLLAGVQMVHVPYKGGDQVITDLIAGRIPVSSSIVATAQSYVTSGKARYLAVLNSRRFPRIGDVATVREVLPGFESPPLWSGYLGPAGLPQAIVRRLNTEIVRAVNMPDVQPRLEAAGLLVVGSSPEELLAFEKSDLESLAKIVKAAKIEPE
jgi:tripartite-type tricarboxylate transporter receptor subunit TctC